jgi:hypothetical protein
VFLADVWLDSIKVCNESYLKHKMTIWNKWQWTPIRATHVHGLGVFSLTQIIKSAYLGSSLMWKTACTLSSLIQVVLMHLTCIQVFRAMASLKLSWFFCSTR